MKRFNVVYMLLVPFLPLIVLYQVLAEEVQNSNNFTNSLIVIFILSLICFIMYIVHLLKLDIDYKIKFIWGVFFLMFLNITQIIYWFKHIKKSW